MTGCGCYAATVLEPEESLMSRGADRIARPIVLFEVHPDRATPHPFFVYRSAKMRNVTGRVYHERLRSGWVPVRILVQGERRRATQRPG
jgi:hypothetical protein